MCDSNLIHDKKKYMWKKINRVTAVQKTSAAIATASAAGSPVNFLYSDTEVLVAE